MKVAADFDKRVLIVDGVEFAPECLVMMANADPKLRYKLERINGSLWFTSERPEVEVKHEPFVASDGADHD